MRTLMDIIGLVVIPIALLAYLLSELFERLGMHFISDLLCWAGDFILDVTVLRREN